MTTCQVCEGVGFVRAALPMLGASDVSAAKGRLRAVVEDAAVGVRAARDLDTERKKQASINEASQHALLDAIGHGEVDSAP